MAFNWSELVGDLSDRQVMIIRYAYGIGAALSLLGTMFMIVAYLAIKAARRKATGTATQLVFCLAVSCLGLACTQLISLSYTDYPSEDAVDPCTTQYTCFSVCKAQAIGLQFFLCASFLWTSCIAFHAYVVLQDRGPKEIDYWNRLPVYLLICFGFPALTVTVGLYFQVFGPTTHKVWCWITEEQQIFRFVLLYGPLILLWIFNLIILLLLSRQTRALSYDFIVSKHRQRLRMYLVVFVCCKLPALANRLTELFIPEEVFPLLLTQAVFDALFGFCNSIVYGVTFRRVAAKAGIWCWSRSQTALEVTESLISQRDYSITERMYQKRVSIGDGRPLARSAGHARLSADETHRPHRPTTDKRRRSTSAEPPLQDSRSHLLLSSHHNAPVVVAAGAPLAVNHSGHHHRFEHVVNSTSAVGGDSEHQPGAGSAPRRDV